MKKEIFINASMGETRLAICEDGRMSELYFEKAENQRMVGDVYYGQVAKVLKGIQAAFVNIGMTQDAFLHFSLCSSDNFIPEVSNLLEVCLALL